MEPSSNLGMRPSQTRKYLNEKGVLVVEYHIRFLTLCASPPLKLNSEVIMMAHRREVKSSIPSTSKPYAMESTILKLVPVFAQSGKG